MSRERFEELLDDWARGRLTPDEAREFDALAGSGEDWREEAEAHRALLRAISAARAVRAPEGLLAGALEKARHPEAQVLEVAPRAAAAKRPMLRWALSAAAAVVVLGGSYLAWESSGSMTKQDAGSASLAVSKSDSSAPASKPSEAEYARSETALGAAMAPPTEIAGGGEPKQKIRASGEEAEQARADLAAFEAESAPSVEAADGDADMMLAAVAEEAPAAAAGAVTQEVAQQVPADEPAAQILAGAGQLRDALAAAAAVESKEASPSPRRAIERLEADDRPEQKKESRAEPERVVARATAQPRGTAPARVAEERFAAKGLAPSARAAGGGRTPEKVNAKPADKDRGATRLREAEPATVAAQEGSYDEKRPGERVFAAAAQAPEVPRNALVQHGIPAETVEFFVAQANATGGRAVGNRAGTSGAVSDRRARANERGAAVTNAFADNLAVSGRVVDGPQAAEAPSELVLEFPNAKSFDAFWRRVQIAPADPAGDKVGADVVRAQSAALLANEPRSTPYNFWTMPEVVPAASREMAFDALAAAPPAGEKARINAEPDVRNLNGYVSEVRQEPPAERVVVVLRQRPREPNPLLAR